MIRIVTDSAADLTKNELSLPGVYVVPMTVTFADGTSVEDDGSMTRDEYFSRLAGESKLPRTSQPSPESFMKAFRDAQEAGDEVVVVTISQTLSGTWQCAKLAAAEVELCDLARRERRLKEVLETVADQFDYVFIDCPPSLGQLTVNALTACHRVLVPMQCEYYALEGLSQLVSSIRMVKRSSNPGIDIEGIVLTMYDSRTNLTIQVAEEVKKYFGNKVFKTVIPRNVRLSEAPSHGMPVIAYDRFSRGAAAYNAVAEEFLKRGGN